MEILPSPFTIVSKQQLHQQYFHNCHTKTRKNYVYTHTAMVTLHTEMYGILLSGVLLGGKFE